MRIEVARVKPLHHKKSPGVYQFALNFYTDSGTPVFTGGGLRFCFEGEKAGEIWDARIRTPKFWITIGRAHPILHDRIRAALTEIIASVAGVVERRQATLQRKLVSDEVAAIWAGACRDITDPPETAHD